MDNTKKDPQYIEDINCDRWWDSHSRQIPVTDYPITITYQSRSKKDADMNWHSPAAVIYSSDDGRVGPEASIDSPNHYREYAVIRSDAYAWKSAARQIQYESIRTAHWTTWDNWKKENRAGVSCTVTAARYQSYVLVRMENAGQIVSATITLPDNAPDDIYLSMTGEFCNITDFLLSRESEPIGPGTIELSRYERDFIPRKAGDIPNVDCPGWWTEHSDGIEISETPITVRFQSISYPNARETWHSPFVVLFSSLDKLVNGVAYKEFSITRDDGYGWKSDSLGFATREIHADSFVDWSTWLAQNKKGVEGVLTAYMKGDSVILDIENNGVKTKSQTLLPPGNSLPVCVALSGELCAITNIRISSAK